MIWWTCDHTTLDKIRNEVMRDKVGLALRIKDKMGEMGLVAAAAPMRRCERTDSLEYREGEEGVRRIGMKLSY